jgi:hypothetical protein
MKIAHLSHKSMLHTSVLTCLRVKYIWDLCWLVIVSYYELPYTPSLPELIASFLHTISSTDEHTQLKVLTATVATIAEETNCIESASIGKS